MFDNIGGKIKKLATIVAIGGIVCSIIFGIAGITNSNSPEEWFLMLFIIIIGCLLSWIGSFFTYGFGELIENSSIIAKATIKENPSRKNTNKAIQQTTIVTNGTNNNDDVAEFDDNIPRENECPFCFHKIKKTDKECNYCGNPLKHE